MSRPHRSPRRSRRLLAAAALAVPLIAVPVAVPAAAVAVTVDARAHLADAWGGYGGYGSYGGFGSLGGYGYGGYGDDGLYGGAWSGGSTTTTQDATQDATAASASESRGVVLIDTVDDYGQSAAAGTGLVIGSDGLVVTNHHVVAGATSITVTVPSSGQKYTATVLGYDATHDVAVLRLAGASDLATVSTDTTTSVGEAVSAVGNAEGADALTAADGKILVNRTAIDVTEDGGSTAHLAKLIEDSADVVPGDSGGALLDADGEVVGMNVAASSGSAQVTGYAIPIGRVLRIATRIVEGEQTGSIHLGSSAALGVELDSDSTAPYVADVVSGGAAAAAGVTSGDTITALDGTSVSSYSDLTGVLSHLKPGDRVALSWTDAQGAAHSATVTLGTAPIG